MVPDALPKVLIEVREDSEVAAIAGENPHVTTPRVRGFEPAPGDAQAGNDQAPYKAFVVLVQLDAPRLPRVPVQRPRIAARCYGRTHAEAAALRWAVSNAIHMIGPRVHANGLGIYLSKDESGGEQEKDPDTSQPYQTLFIDLFATTQAVTTGS
jgi:hypothetical protein